MGSSTTAAAALNRRGDDGYVLAFTVVLLFLLAGLSLHLLTESRLKLQAAEQAWTDERLAIAAESAARRALQACADLPARSDARPPDPDRPHVLWASTWTDPLDTRIDAQLMDAQRRFDLYNLAVEPGSDEPPAEGVRAAVELLRLHGDLAPGPRVDALARALAARTGTVEDGHAQKMPLTWSDLLGMPEFGAVYLRNPAAGRIGWIGPNRAVSSFATLLPHPAEERPLPVNLNTAYEETLRALLGSDQQPAVERLLARRADTPFGSAEEAAAWSGLAADRIMALQAWVTTDSEWFEVQSRAVRDGREAAIYALARRDPAGDVRIYRWSRLR